MSRRCWTCLHARCLPMHGFHLSVRAFFWKMSQSTRRIRQVLPNSQERDVSKNCDADGERHGCILNHTSFQICWVQVINGRDSDKKENRRIWSFKIRIYKILALLSRRNYKCIGSSGVAVIYNYLIANLQICLNKTTYTSYSTETLDIFLLSNQALI